MIHAWKTAERNGELLILTNNKSSRVLQGVENFLILNERLSLKAAAWHPSESSINYKIKCCMVWIEK